MEHSVQAYLKRLPTEKLEKFLQDYISNQQTENFSGVIDDVVQELARRENARRSTREDPLCCLRSRRRD